MLTQPNTLYLLIADGKVAHCQQWLVEPEYNTMTRQLLVAGNAATDTMEFRIHANQLSLMAIRRDYYPNDQVGFETCGSQFEVRETGRGLVIGDSIWFRTFEGCNDAIAHHERVATDLDCKVVEPVAASVQAASRSKLENVLARGGTMFAIADGPGGQRCKRVRVQPSSRDSTRDVLEGSLEVEVVREDGVKGTRAHGYLLERGATSIALTGPGITWRDGSGHAFG